MRQIASIENGTHTNLKPRIVIAEDHALVAAGFRAILQDNFDVVAIASNGQELLSLVETTEPDLVTVDVGMPKVNGLKAARMLRADYPRCKIVFVSEYADRATVSEAFRAGASGYVVKTDAPNELEHALCEALAGRSYLSPAVQEEVSTPIDGPELSNRQLEVLRLVTKGYCAKEISEYLNIAIKTVEYHKSIIKQQIGVRSTPELIRFALDNNIADRILFEDSLCSSESISSNHEQNKNGPYDSSSMRTEIGSDAVG